jgi:hypothetical protein
MLVKSRSIYGDLLKVVAAMTQIEQIPCTMVAPVLRVVTAKVGERMGGALRWKQLADSTCSKGNLHTAKTNVPVNVVF